MDGYTRKQAVIEQMIDHGASTEEIKAKIDRSKLSQEEKDALHLWAWAWAESARGIKVPA